MQVKELRSVYRAQPFRSFGMHRADGRAVWVRYLLVLITTSGLVVVACDRDSGSTKGTKTEKQHPHTGSMLKMIKVMEGSGYHPTSREKNERSFADDPIPWLGPWHIAAPRGDDIQVEWRISIYKRDSKTQPHSFLSVEQDRRIDDHLLEVLRAEWERVAEIGLPQDVLTSGAGLVHAVAEEAVRKRAERRGASFSINDVSEVSGSYELQVELHDRKGSSGAERAVAAFGRIILYFTYTGDD